MNITETTLHSCRYLLNKKHPEEAKLIECVSEAIKEVGALREALARQLSQPAVAPSERAVKAAEEIFPEAQTQQPHEKTLNDALRQTAARIIQRTCFPPGEGRDTELQFLRNQVVAMNSERSKDYWIWQGDGTDKLESLACHVLIHANDLRALARAVPPGDGEEWANAATEEIEELYANAKRASGTSERMDDSSDRITAIILKHAPRPTAASESGAGEAVRKALERTISAIDDLLHHGTPTIDGPYQADAEGAQEAARLGRSALEMLTKHGLGASEDTAIVEWLEKRGGQLTCRKGFPEHHDGARFFAWEGMDEQYTGLTIRDVYRAAMQQGGKTP